MKKILITEGQLKRVVTLIKESKNKKTEVKKTRKGMEEVLGKPKKK